MATWPTLLPGGTTEGYGFEPQAQFARTDMDAGPARQRRRFTAAPTHVQMQWFFTRAEFEIFEAWFAHVLSGGTAWFEIPLWSGSGYTLVEARFFEEVPYRATLPGPVHFAVEAKLEVRERPVLSAAALDAILNPPAP